MLHLQQMKDPEAPSQYPQTRNVTYTSRYTDGRTRDPHALTSVIDDVGGSVDYVEGDDWTFDLESRPESKLSFDMVQMSVMRAEPR